MVGKRAKILSPDHIEDLLVFARQTRHPIRNQVLVLLSVKAGLRAGEIANLTWPMVIGPTAKSARPSNCKTESQRRAAASHSSSPRVTRRLIKLASLQLADGPVIRSERGGPMTPVSIICWFARAFRAIGLEGCSSHSGRRTFITRAARLVHKAGGSLARRSAAGWASVDPNDPAVHRRRH